MNVAPRASIDGRIRMHQRTMTLHYGLIDPKSSSRPTRDSRSSRATRTFAGMPLGRVACSRGSHKQRRRGSPCLEITVQGE